MIRLLSKNLPIIVVLVGLTGCGGGVLGIGDETSLYRVGNNADTAPAVAQGRLPLYIARPQMPSGADADRIPTVEMQEITYLAEARWASPAPEMISDLLKESIERNVNQAYVPIQSGLPDHHLLSTRFTSYAAYYENGSEKPPVIRVVAQAALARAAHSGPLAVGKFSRQVPAVENTVSSVIDAFNTASVQIADEMAVWVGENMGE